MLCAIACDLYTRFIVDVFGLICCFCFVNIVIPVVSARCPSDAETDTELPDEWCHLSKEFVNSKDHDYGKRALEISLNISEAELEDDFEHRIEEIITDAFGEYGKAGTSFNEKALELQINREGKSHANVTKTCASEGKESSQKSIF